MEREDAERADARREQAIADSWRCREIAELYDDSFRSFGVSTPSHQMVNGREIPPPPIR